MKKKQTVLLVCGMGGHSEQMIRLIKNIDHKERYNFVAVVDGEVNFAQCEFFITERRVLLPLRSKYKKSIFIIESIFSLTCFIRALCDVFRIFRKFDVCFVVSTGPGIIIPVALISRIFRRFVLHIETWSRFRSRSFTGRVMYLLASEFWIQHESLSVLYPKSRFVGLL